MKMFEEFYEHDPFGEEDKEYGWVRSNFVMSNQKIIYLERKLEEIKYVRENFDRQFENLLVFCQNISRRMNGKFHIEKPGSRDAFKIKISEVENTKENDEYMKELCRKIKTLDIMGIGGRQDYEYFNHVGGYLIYIGCSKGK